MTEDKEFCKFYQKGRKCKLTQDDFRCIENLGGNCASYRYYTFELEQERDELRAELHSKVEFIQEQRIIINEYAKEIEIYKQCQGKRASKREEELEQENKELKEKYTHVLELAKTNADSNEYCLQELEKENEAFKQSEQEAIEIIADLKHQLSLYKNSHKTEQDRRRKLENALEEIKSAIVEYLPKKQGDYNFSKSLNPVQYALLEYIQIQINEVLQ